MTVPPNRTPLYLPLLERALAEPIGLAVTTNNPEQLRIDLNETRKASTNPAFDILTFGIPSLPDQVFIYKKTTRLEP